MPKKAEGWKSQWLIVVRSSAGRMWLKRRPIIDADDDTNTDADADPYADSYADAADANAGAGADTDSDGAFGACFGGSVRR